MPPLGVIGNRTGLGGTTNSDVRRTPSSGWGSRHRAGATYVEIIKYALGEQVGALATLRGKLYDLEEAARLGSSHEVVEPDRLLPTAINYARCITPDCNTAYAMSKKALQDGVLRQIEERTMALDERLPAGLAMGVHGPKLLLVALIG